MDWIKDGGITSPLDFIASGINAGIKSDKKKDLALVTTSQPAAAAGMITKNRVQANTCVITAEHLKSGKARAFFINSDNANCATGPKGLAETRSLVSVLAGKLKIPPAEILPASTGVIGVPLPVDKIEASLDRLIAARSVEGGGRSAEAIMTTDTYAKEAALSFEINDTAVKIGAMAKGVGMIEPNMATMLVFLTSDIAISAPLLEKALRGAVDSSFHRLTVDGDTSTNDMALILANGAANNPLIDKADDDYRVFSRNLTVICQKLARMIVKDGEGATKFITITVNNAQNMAEADKIARKVANSNLVKTALFGEDANWGRVLMALGNAGVELDPTRLSIAFGSICVFENGEPVIPLPEGPLGDLLKKPEIDINISLGVGEASNWIWTSDLSYEYVRINADYRS